MHSMLSLDTQPDLQCRVRASIAICQTVFDTLHMCHVCTLRWTLTYAHNTGNVLQARAPKLLLSDVVVSQLITNVTN